MPYAEYKKGSIFFSQKGKGRAVILLHGFLGSSAFWTGLQTKLSKNFRVIVVDLPGHGKSDCYGYVHTMEMMAEAVHAVVKSLRLKKYVMCGHSMGGYVSLAYAELHADDLKGLCLFHSMAQSDSAAKKRERDKAILTVKKSSRQFANALVKKLFTEQNYRKLKRDVSRVKKIALATSKQGIIAGLEGMKNRKNNELVLKFAPFPVLIISGEHDPVIPLKVSRQESLLPEKGELVVLENSAHMGFMEEKEKSYLTLKAFSQAAFKQV